MIEEFDSSAYSRFINNNGSSASGSSSSTPRALTASSALVPPANPKSATPKFMFSANPAGKFMFPPAHTTSQPAPSSTAVSTISTVDAVNKNSSNGFAGKGMLKRMDSVHGRSKELKNFYILSMGHRIQFIQYDETGVSATKLLYTFYFFSDGYFFIHLQTILLPFRFFSNINVLFR